MVDQINPVGFPQRPRQPTHVFGGRRTAVQEHDIARAIADDIDVDHALPRAQPGPTDACPPLQATVEL